MHSFMLRERERERASETMPCCLHCNVSFRTLQYPKISVPRRATKQKKKRKDRVMSLCVVFVCPSVLCGFAISCYLCVCVFFTRFFSPMPVGNKPKKKKKEER